MADVPDRYRPIGDYGLISDCHSTALISSEGSIDWACLRRFDAGSAFARMLDHERGGFFSIRPKAAIERTERSYLGATMVLQTTMHTATGTLMVTDAFAMRTGGAAKPRSQLLRSVECLAGGLEVEVRIEPRFDYGYDGTMRSYEDSLQRLGVDHIDILYIHDIDDFTHGPDLQPKMHRAAMEGTYKALDALRRAGDIKAIGIGVNDRLRAAGPLGAQLD